MPEPRSALATRTTGPAQLAAGLSCRELPFADLAIASAWQDTDPAFFTAVSDALNAPLPTDFRTATTSGALTVFRLSPSRLMIVGESGPLAPLAGLASDERGAAFMLGHARVRIRLEGQGAAALLMRGVAVDLHPDVFRVGEFIQTSAHDIAITIHRPVSENAAYDIYVLRSFALSFWDWLLSSAEIATRATVGEGALET